jgi:hypothetical protein
MALFNLLNLVCDEGEWPPWAREVWARIDREDALLRSVK